MNDLEIVAIEDGDRIVGMSESRLSCHGEAVIGMWSNTGFPSIVAPE